MYYIWVVSRLSAFFAFEMAQPKKGDVIVIGGADGVFGSVLGQLAKERVSSL
jgi:NADPH-dependent curcumin reductase CurA